MTFSSQIVSSLVDLFRLKNLDLALALNPAISPYGVTIAPGTRLAQISLRGSFSLVAGGALVSDGTFSLILDTPSKITIVRPPEATRILLLDPAVTMRLVNNVLEIRGIRVDGPGPLNPPLTSARIDGRSVVLQVGPLTQTFDLPPL